MIGLDLGYIFNNQERSAGIVRMCINIHNKIHTKMVNALFLYIAVYFEILDIKSWPHTLYSLKPGRRLRRRLYRLWLGRCWVRSQTVNIRHVWYSRSCVRLPLEWIEVGRQPMRSSGAGSVGGRVLHNLTATQPSSQTDPLFFFFCPFIINVEDNSKLDSQLKTFFLFNLFDWSHNSSHKYLWEGPQKNRHCKQQGYGLIFWTSSVHVQILYRYINI